MIRRTTHVYDLKKEQYSEKHGSTLKQAAANECLAEIRYLHKPFSNQQTIQESGSPDVNPTVFVMIVRLKVGSKDWHGARFSNRGSFH